jgi:Zn-dependent peptidase ImmA (M78 family)
VAYLDRFVSFPGVRFPDFSMPNDPGKISNEDIERLAEQTRSFWGLGEGPISNVVWLLENNGSIVTRENMESNKLDAFSEWFRCDRASEIPYVFLNAEKDSGFRSRYDIAHELGHLILHRNIDKKYITNKQTFKLIEEQAYRFGGAFLLPASTFSNDFSVPSLDSFRALKPKWKVSAAAMVYRSADLNLASKEQVQRLWRSRSRRGWVYKEPLDDQLSAEKPRLLSRIFQLLVSENVQSRAEIRDSLPYSTRDIEKLTGLELGFLEEGPAKRSVVKRNTSDKPADILRFRDM